MDEAVAPRAPLMIARLLIGILIWNYFDPTTAPVSIDGSRSIICKLNHSIQLEQKQKQANNNNTSTSKDKQKAESKKQKAKSQKTKDPRRKNVTCDVLSTTYLMSQGSRPLSNFGSTSTLSVYSCSISSKLTYHFGLCKTTWQF